MAVMIIFMAEMLNEVKNFGVRKAGTQAIYF